MEIEASTTHRIAYFSGTMVAHFVSILLTGFIVYTAWPCNYLFAWHPILMTLAFPLLMFQGVSVFSPEGSLLKNYSRITKVFAHWAIQALSIICAVGGFSVIYYNKYAHGKYHFTSWHGLLGVIAVGYAIVQATGGVVLKYSTFVNKYIKRVTLKELHATSALLAFLLICGVYFLGLQSKWFTNNAATIQWYACVSCVAVLLLAVMNQIVTAYAKPWNVIKPNKQAETVTTKSKGSKSPKSGKSSKK